MICLHVFPYVLKIVIPAIFVQLALMEMRVTESTSNVVATTYFECFFHRKTKYLLSCKTMLQIKRLLFYNISWYSLAHFFFCQNLIRSRCMVQFKKVKNKGSRIALKYTLLGYWDLAIHGSELNSGESSFCCGQDIHTKYSSSNKKERSVYCSIIWSNI